MLAITAAVTMFHASFIRRSCRVKPEETLQSFKLSCNANAAFPEVRIGVGLLSATCTQTTIAALQVEWNMPRPYTKGEEHMLESAWKGEPHPQTLIWTHFHPVLVSIVSGACWASAKTGFMSLSFIIELC